MLSDFFQWFTDPNNARIFVTVLFFVTYSLVLLYIYSNKKRSKRLESYKNIPFQDGDDDVTPQRKENEHE